MLILFRQLAVLDQLYRIYDQFTASLPLACRKFCADCCTCNVAITTLEGRKILSGLDGDTRTPFMEKLKQQSGRPRFIPKFTTNRLADLCLAGEDPPEEAIDPTWGSCPLLTDDACPIYDTRPFACRCMVSTQRCGESGAADMDDVTLTVNHIFLQYIEHIDQNGYSGNFSDVLAHLHRHETGAAAAGLPDTLIPNTPMTTLMIPPELREKIMPVLAAIQAIKG